MPRIERALLGMVPVPGERLLAVYGRGSEAQARHVTNIFIALGPEAAQLLVSHLVDPNPRVQEYVRDATGRMPGQVLPRRLPPAAPTRRRCCKPRQRATRSRRNAGWRRWR